MYERFTDRLRKVMQLSNQEAQRLNHKYIGTEHILLGLLREQEGVAAQVLMNLGLNVESAREQILKLLADGLGRRDESGSGSSCIANQIVVEFHASTNVCHANLLAAWNRLASAVTILQHEGAIKPLTADELRRQLAILKPTN